MELERRTFSLAGFCKADDSVCCRLLLLFVCDLFKYVVLS